jgi:hypothetical protein
MIEERMREYNIKPELPGEEIRPHIIKKARIFNDQEF